ncbi:MAG: hypothetical protein H7Y11_15300 [Armatimonadetes bacterium]|nr:hypothetical protein [Anaerolineae bacterium]
MIWIIALSLLLLVAALSFNIESPIPWAKQLRRIAPGTDHAEWGAPDYVVQQVRNDYSMSVRWLRESALAPLSEQRHAAPQFLSGNYLKHFQTLTAHYQKTPPRYIDLADAQHAVAVRYFSADGERCLVIDRQTERSIIAYERQTRTIRLRQRLDDEITVYLMQYDRHSCRWKLAQYIQTLPPGWGRATARPSLVKVTSTLPPTLGRDH